MENEIKCRYCKSNEVIKYGNRNNKSGKIQIYKCNSCKKILSDNTTFPKMKHKGEIITVALDLYFKNMSLRGVKDHLRQIYGVKVSHVTILFWIRKYSKIFKEFTDKLKGESSGVLHADEMMVSVKGKWYWLWNVIDKETKFITACKLSKVRYQDDAVGIFKETKSKLINKPKIVITDGLQAYDKAIRKVFWRHPQTKHVWSTGLRGSINNNLVERFNGTVRDRIKVTRGFDQPESTADILNGFMTYYNFIRPHLSLNGMTPAEASRINLHLNGGNRWMELVKMAMESKLDGNQNNGHTISEPEKDVIYKVRIFDEHGNEFQDPKRELGMRTNFEFREKAEKWVEFYKLFHSKYKFVIERTITL